MADSHITATDEVPTNFTTDRPNHHGGHYFASEAEFPALLPFPYILQAKSSWCYSARLRSELETKKDNADHLVVDRGAGVPSALLAVAVGRTLVAVEARRVMLWLTAHIDTSQPPIHKVREVPIFD